jgi:hypothetical protein
MHVNVSQWPLHAVCSADRALASCFRLARGGFFRFFAFVFLPAALFIGPLLYYYY